MDALTANTKAMQIVWNISQAKFSENQMHIDDYFKRLSLKEIHWIRQFIKDLLNIESKYFRKHTTLYLIIAVGTTTYPQKHWDGLEKYLKENDPSKIKFAKRGGEDIDLKLIPESKDTFYNPWIIPTYKKMSNSNKKLSFSEVFKKRKEIYALTDMGFGKLSDADKYLWEHHDFFQAIIGTLVETNMKYKIYPAGSPFGAHYLKVPDEYIEQEKQTVVRTKGIDYGDPTVYVEIPNGRKIYIYIDDAFSAPKKIEQEKSENYCFSVIYRATCCEQLDEAINKRELAQAKK